MGWWSFLLPPVYEALRGKPLEDIAAFQWVTANTTILEDLALVSRDCWTTVSHESFLAAPLEETRRLCAFMQVKFDSALLEAASQPLKPSRYTLTIPARDKWRKNEASSLACFRG